MMQSKDAACCDVVVVTGETAPSQATQDGGWGAYTLARGLFGALVTLAPLPTPKYDKIEAATEWKATSGEVSATLARMLECPITIDRLGPQVGRFVYVEYTPALLPDPDAVIMVGNMSAVVNRAVRSLQDARWGRIFQPAQWYTKVEAIVATLRERLIAVRASADETAFVLRWAMTVRDSGRTIAGRAVTDVPREMM